MITAESSPPTWTMPTIWPRFNYRHIDTFLSRIFFIMKMRVLARWLVGLSSYPEISCSDRFPGTLCRATLACCCCWWRETVVSSLNLLQEKVGLSSLFSWSHSFKQLTACVDPFTRVSKIGTSSHLEVNVQLNIVETYWTLKIQVVNSECCCSMLKQSFRGICRIGSAWKCLNEF